MPFAKKEKVVAPKVVITAPTTKAEKFAALMLLSKALDKENDTTNTLVRLGKQVGVPLPSIHTGLPSLDDFVFGCGGVPRGTVIEVFGPESSGKTTMALQIVAAAQAQGDIAAYVDAEHALDPTYAKVLGVDVDNLLINQPDNGEEALDLTLKLIRSKCVGIIIVDSVAALVPKAELAGDIGDAHPGLQARMMSQALRMLVGEAKKNLVTVIFINQIREKIGVMFGNPETTAGGRALKFYSTIRLDVRRREAIKDGSGDHAPIVGHELELKAVKNKVGTPFRSTKLSLYYPGTRFTAGLDKLGDLIDYASRRGIFTMNGSWFNLDLGRKYTAEDELPKGKKVGDAIGVEQLANGKANLRDAMIDTPLIELVTRTQLTNLRLAELKAEVTAPEEKAGL